MNLVAPDLAGKLPPVELSREALDFKAGLLQSAATVTAVTCDAEQAKAAEVAGFIRASVRDAKEEGLAIRRPVNALLKQIKEVEDQYIGELEGAQRRIERLVMDFAEKERRRVEADERRRAEEINRLREERERAEAEARHQADAMQSEADLEAAVKAEAEAKAREAAAQAAIVAPMPEVVKPKGMSVRKVLRYEVTDIHALYKVRPDLVRMELNSAGVQSTCVPEIPVPGLKLWWEERAVTQARRR